MEWLSAGLALLATVWFYFQYRRAQRQSDTFREDARQRMQELASLGYSEDRVGRRVAAVGDASTLEVLGSPWCGKGEPSQIVRVGHASPACLFRVV